ncbi:MAG: signal peptidase I [Clostridiales bacterium]|nr:signal peptidase I [Clostridiales bacterium]
MKKGNKFVLNLWIAVMVVYIAYYVSANYVQLALIQGDSMLPSYHNMQIVLVGRQYEDVQRNDVVLFECETLDAVLVKRIVAIPGDMLTICDEKILINGVATDIPWEGEENRTLLLSSNEFFVVGDNYSASIDSRSEEVGIVSIEKIIGKVY